MKYYSDMRESLSHNFVNWRAIASHNWIIGFSITVYRKYWYYFFSAFDEYVLSFAVSDFAHHSINDWSFFTSNMKSRKQSFKLKELLHYESLEIICRISILVKNLWKHVHLNKVTLRKNFILKHDMEKNKFQ